MQHKLTFAVLALEIALFVILAFPGLHEFKRGLVRTVTSHPYYKDVKTVLIVVGSIVGLVFFDSLNRGGARFAPARMTRL